MRDEAKADGNSVQHLRALIALLACFKVGTLFPLGQPMSCTNLFPFWEQRISQSVQNYTNLILTVL